MLLVGLGFIYLAITRDLEPYELLPIGLGILIANLVPDLTRLTLFQEGASGYQESGIFGVSLPLRSLVLEPAAPDHLPRPRRHDRLRAAHRQPAPDAPGGRRSDRHLRRSMGRPGDRLSRPWHRLHPRAVRGHSHHWRSRRPHGDLPLGQARPGDTGHHRGHRLLVHGRHSIHPAADHEAADDGERAGRSR